MSDGNTFERSFIPDDLTRFTLKNFTAGLVTNAPPDTIPEQALTVAENVMIKPTGPTIREGIAAYSTETFTEDATLQDLVGFWDTSGNSYAVLIGEKYLYSRSAAAFSAVYDTYTTGTVSGSSGTASLTGSGTAWDTNDIKGDDVIILDPSGTAEEKIISSVGGPTSITLTSNLANTYSGDAYQIRRIFNPSSPQMVDYTLASGKMYFTDGVHKIREYDGSTLSPSDVTQSFSCQVVVYHADRLFAMNTEESGTEYRQRIRWSSVTDPTSFPSANFVDLPYTTGAIRQAFSLGQMLVVYFEDAVFMGRPTNIPSLPFEFERFETGNIGVVGQKAVFPWFDGHFFMGQDDIYFISYNGFERIGTPVIDSLYDGNSSNLWRSYVVTDPDNRQILFGLPDGTSTEIKVVWAYNNDTKAWSKFISGRTLGFLASASVTDTVTWADLTDTGSGGILTSDNWSSLETDGYQQWNDFKDNVGLRTLFCGIGTKIYQVNDTTYQDFDATYNAVLETKDFDFGGADDTKTLSRVHLRLNDFTVQSGSEAATLQLQASRDRGNTYTSLGSRTLDLTSALNEFVYSTKFTATNVRFKITLTATDLGTENPLGLSSMSFRLRRRGREVPARNF